VGANLDTWPVPEICKGIHRPNRAVSDTCLSPVEYIPLGAAAALVRAPAVTAQRSPLEPQCAD
jgi:hypothetical protein